MYLEIKEVDEWLLRLHAQQQILNNHESKVLPNSEITKSNSKQKLFNYLFTLTVMFEFGLLHFDK